MFVDYRLAGLSALDAHYGGLVALAQTKCDDERAALTQLARAFGIAASDRL
jgi:hypothetical protein